MSNAIAIIPARGGSKRIPRKNIKFFNGKPMIAWSIEAALKSGCFNQVVVSTDDEEIANVARQFGADVPFIRPLELSNDYAGTTEVIQHAIQTLLAQEAVVDYACCLYATAPFVTTDDIQKGYQLLVDSESIDYAFSVTAYPYPIQRALRMTDEGRIKMCHPENFQKRSQDLEETFHDAGQFYWGTVDAWLNARMVFSEKSMPVVLPHYRVQDIDTMDDWIRAEMMYKVLQEQGLL